MKVLHVVGSMNMGGAETFLMNILRNIDPARVKFIFLCYFDGEYDFEDEINSSGAKIVRIKDNRIKNPIKFVRDIKKVIKDEQIDIVHSHVDFSSGYAMLASKSAGIKVRVAHAHSASTPYSVNIIRIIWLKLLKQLMVRNGTTLVACGEAAGKFMFNDSSFHIIRNGINLQRFKFNNTTRSAMRYKLGIDEYDTVLLHVGRFEEVKNHTFLIDIFANYYSINKSAKLILLGDGSLFDAVKNKVDSLGLKDSIYLAGSQANTQDYYSASDLFVMPSIYEGLPVTLIEAQANGLRCLVSDKVDHTANYGLIDFISLKQPPSEWVRLVEKISDLKRKSAHRQLVQDYSIDRVVKQLEEIYGSK